MKRLSSLLIPVLLTGLVFYLVFSSVPEPKRVRSLISSQTTVIELPRVEVLYRALSSPQDIIAVRCDAVVPVTYTRVVSLAGLQPQERKRKFIHMVLPSVLVVNYEVSHTRKNLIKVLEKLRLRYKLSKAERDFVESMLDRCRADSIEDVLLKANPVPPSLVIAQAAVESGWGTSRFFVEGNNLFGMWAFRDKSRTIEAKESGVHLKRYDSILEAVRDYVYNVNVSWAYHKFREHRRKSFDPFELSEFLSFYSIERERYVRKLKKIIEKNNLTELDYCVLDPAYIR
ncbi:glucosaminidase domain-containing protein [Hydrogenivirga sp.]